MGGIGTKLGIECVGYYYMQSAVCMSGLGSKFGIK
jgi:hypothetical protein